MKHDSACMKDRYDLIFENYGFESGRMKYAAGEEVEVTYGFLATDTDYRFYADVEDLKQDYDPIRGMILRFVMPDHDVRVSVEHHNSMTFDPDAQAKYRDTDENETGGHVSDDGREGGRWFCPECGTRNTGAYCSQCGMKRPE